MREELYVIHSHYTGLQNDATKKALSQILARHKSNSGKTDCPDMKCHGTEPSSVSCQQGL